MPPDEGRIAYLEKLDEVKLHQEFTSHFDREKADKTMPYKVGSNACSYNNISK